MYSKHPTCKQTRCYLKKYGAIIESHHASFLKAKKAIANLHGMEGDREVSAAQKLTARDRDVSELRKSLQ